MNKKQRMGFLITLWAIAICGGSFLIGAAATQPEQHCMEIFRLKENFVGPQPTECLRKSARLIPLTRQVATAP